MYNAPSTMYNSAMRKGTNTNARKCQIVHINGKWEILKDGGKVPENQPCRQCCSGYHSTPGR